MFWKSRRRKIKDLSQQLKMEESQRVLLSAATQTANAAHAVTTLLKSRLDDSLRQFECTARVMNDALFVCDLDGTIRASNPAARHMFAQPSLIGSSILTLFDLGGETLSDASALWSLIRHTNRWSTNQVAPLRGRQPITGSLFWIEPSCVTLDWSDGSASIIALVRNIQPIAALRDSARDAKARFQQAFDLTYEGMVIVQDGKIQAANAAVGALFGYTTAELLGAPLVDLFVREEHGIVSAGLDTTEYTVHGLHANGTLRSVLFSSAEIMWHARTASLITMRDVTGLQERDAASGLRIDNGVDMACCFDGTFTIVWENRRFCETYGGSAGTTIGGDVRELLGTMTKGSFERDVSGLDRAVPAVRQREEIAGAERIRDWVVRAAFDAVGTPLEYQWAGREIEIGAT